jgi:hypothetical protein
MAGVVSKALMLWSLLSDEIQTFIAMVVLILPPQQASHQLHYAWSARSGHMSELRPPMSSTYAYETSLSRSPS